MTEVTSDTEISDAPESTWTVDELARRAELPVRTIRQYQTMGLLHPPRRQGRIGLYDPSHLRRLHLIGRLQERGYSLAGIADLLSAWRNGADITDILGLEPDQLVHVDEPGVPATADTLSSILPALVPGRFEELLATGVVEHCGPDRYCIPSPSLLQLAVDTLEAGLEPDMVLQLLGDIRQAADIVTDSVLQTLTALPADVPDAAIEQLAGKGRGLLAHGVGRLTLHRLGQRLGIDDDTPADDVSAKLAASSAQHGGGASEQ